MRHDVVELESRDFDEVANIIHLASRTLKMLKVDTNDELVVRNLREQLVRASCLLRDSV